ACSKSEQTTELAEKVEEGLFEKASSYFPQHIDSCIHYFTLGLPYYESRGDWVNYINCINALGSCAYYQGDYAQWIDFTERALIEAKQKLEKDNDAYSSALYNQARVFTVMGDYDRSIQMYEQALQIEETNGTPAGIAATMSNIGRTLLNKGDFSASLEYSHKALDERRRSFGEISDQVSYSYFELGQLQTKLEQKDSARVYFERCIQLLSIDSIGGGDINSGYLLAAHTNLAELAMEAQDSESFAYHIQMAVDLTDSTSYGSIDHAHRLRGEFYQQRREYKQAISFFEKAFTVAQEKFSSFDYHASMGIYLVKLGDCYYDMEDYEQSLATYQRAFLHFSDDLDSATPYANPPRDKLHANTNVLELLEGKAKALLQRYQQTQDPTLRDRAIDTYLLAIEFIRQLRQEYLAWESKTILSERVIPIFEGAMAALYQKYQDQASPELAEQIFQLAESSKAALLLESIQENNALGFAGIPTNLVRRERELKSTISFHQKEILKNRGSQTAADKVKRLEDALFQLRRQHQELIDQIERDYPRYYQIKHDRKLATIEQVQQNLGDDRSVLLEYFVGEKHHYLIGISQRQTLIRRLPRSAELKDQTDQLRRLLHLPPTSKDPLASHRQFVDLTRSLHDQLLGDVPIPISGGRLLIAPDDLIGYIPFEVLLRNAPEVEQLSYAPDHLDYLINFHQISYTYSATLWLQNLSRQKSTTAPRTFLGMAPNFGTPAIAQTTRLRACENDYLSPLQCNEREVEQVEAIMGGKTWIGKRATKAQFLQNSRDYRILHLATHSCLDDETPLNNKIFLADDYLSHFDLSNLELRADLAVLSACNTGNGPLQKGEGVMSLSRGFILAGCPSTLISLWSVEDCTTAEIMREYYAQLRTGATKDGALSAAKRQFLARASRLQSHPFYWAPFVQFGDRSALEF
ncbi:MAG: CHAT domain-containing tetratricopeptide repeat protein, partial [Bacteroidota bacterium]